MAEPLLMRRLAAITLRKFFNFLGWAGVMFILYGVVSHGTGSVWEPLERWVNPASAFLTLLGVILTAASVYFCSPQSHPPEGAEKRAEKRRAEKRGRESFLDWEAARAIEAVACRDALAMPPVD